jgi:hypothetical protein
MVNFGSLRRLQKSMEIDFAERFEVRKFGKKGRF